MAAFTWSVSVPHIFGWSWGCTARRQGKLRCTIHLTYPGHHSPIEAGQLGVVIGNLFFDNPAEQADRQTQSGRPTRRGTQRQLNNTTRRSLETLPFLCLADTHWETFTLCKSHFCTWLSTSFASTGQRNDRERWHSQSESLSVIYGCLSSNAKHNNVIRAAQPGKDRAINLRRCARFTMILTDRQIDGQTDR